MPFLVCSLRQPLFDMNLGLKSGDLAVMTQAARAGRRMLSKEQNPPIGIMMEAGIIKPLVDALCRDEW